MQICIPCACFNCLIRIPHPISYQLLERKHLQEVNFSVAFLSRNVWFSFLDSGADGGCSHFWENISDSGWGSPKEALAGPNPLLHQMGTESRGQASAFGGWRSGTGGLASGSWVAPVCLLLVSASGPAVRGNEPGLRGQFTELPSGLSSAGAFWVMEPWAG